MAKPLANLILHLAVSAACLFSALLVLSMTHIKIPPKLLKAEGEITNREPIYSKGNLTGFRFCIDQPRLTFTYQNPEPRVSDMWGAINKIERIEILYANNSRGNPTLWQISAQGFVLATPKELQSARLNEFFLFLAMAIGAVVYAMYRIVKYRSSAA